MSQTTEIAGPPISQPEPPEPAAPARTTTTTKPSWWRRPWVIPAWAVIVAFIAYTLPDYIAFDPATANIPFLRHDLPVHYVMLVSHVMFGTLTMLAMAIQIWPWIRKHYPAVHRWSGRVYVFGGVIPSAVMALGISPFSAGPAGNSVAAFLWLAATIAGFRAARQRRYADHRRWMIYSFALTLQIVWGRVLLEVLPLFPNYNFDDPHTQAIVLDSISWIGFIVNLLIAQIYLEWTARRNARRRGRKNADVGMSVTGGGAPTAKV